MRIRANIDNPPLIRIENSIPQQIREIEMSKVVNSKRHLYTLLITLPLIHAHTRVVIQEVDPTEFGENELRKLLHGSLDGEIERVGDESASGFFREDDYYLLIF
jgi:hypothetical protein